MNRDEVQEIVYQAIGEASMCWSETPKGVFEEKQANIAAEKIMKAVDDIWSKPWLGNATTAELLEELKARAEVGGYANYKTVND